MASVIIGCDVGGTFTDLILLDKDRNELSVAKVPTVIANQADGVLNAITQTGATLASIEAFIHGTTATTNAILERKLARCGLITTKGFRDVLELGRRTRPKPYGLIGHFEPLIPRELRVEVNERMNAGGEIVRPLVPAEVEEAIRILLDRGAESLTIHFLHSYANGAHERQAADIARKLWPNGYITVGHEVVGEYREYERGVTAAVNGSVQPILHRYVDRLQQELERRGLRRNFLVMQGNGGTVSFARAAQNAVHTVMSGPASGVIAAAHTATQAGFRNVITYDMGGTSTDVALIQDGNPLVSSELELEYAMPIHVPMVDVHTVGAGGGSIASVDEAGIMHVGPESAGALPGPICFGRGGTRPTITDANLVLGRLNSERLLAVSEKIDVQKISDRLAECVGHALGLDGRQTAAAILRIANDRMAGAIRLVSLGRGYDPRDFCLFAFGGAGPLHAATLARELDIPTVVVPARPGLTNAFGCLVADLRHDFVQTINQPLSQLQQADVVSVIDAQISEGRAMLEQESVKITSIVVSHRADMQFRGQSHVLSVDFTSSQTEPKQLHELFAAAYWQRFEVELSELRPVLVNVHTAVIGKREAVFPRCLVQGERAASIDAACRGSRTVWFEQGWIETPIYLRDQIPLGQSFSGPAILEQLDATTVIEPNNHVTLDCDGNVIISVSGAYNDPR